MATRRGKQQREYDRWYRTHPAGRFCDCGKPAAKYAKSSWMCADCMALQEAARQREARRALAGRWQRGTNADIQARCYDGFTFTAEVKEERGCLVFRAHGTYVRHYA